MKQQTRIHPDRASLSPEEVEAILWCACAERGAALARAICAVVGGLAGALWRFPIVLREACRLRALASLDDRRLAMLGIARCDVPAIVFGWMAGRAPTERLARDAAEAPPPYRLEEAA